METSVILFFAAFVSACCVAYCACNIAFRIEDRVKSLESQVERLASMLDKIQRDVSYLAIREENKDTKVHNNKNAN